MATGDRPGGGEQASLRLGTVVLEVSDLDRSIELYRDGFGLDSTSPTTRAAATAPAIAGSVAGTQP